MIDTAGPRTGLPARTDAERPRRRPWIVLLAALGVIVLSVTGAVLTNYQPLVLGGEAAGAATARPVGFLNAGEGRIPRYADGTRLIAVIWLHNDGPWGVTVTGVQRDDPEANLLWLSDVRVPKMPTWSIPSSQPFRPLAVGPGDSAAIQLVLTAGNCADSDDGTWATVSDVRVHFRVLGIARSVWLPLLTPVRAAAPADADCPARPARLS